MNFRSTRRFFRVWYIERFGSFLRPRDFVSVLCYTREEAREFAEIELAGRHDIKISFFTSLFTGLPRSLKHSYEILEVD